MEGDLKMTMADVKSAGITARIYQIQDMLSMIKAAAHAISKGDLEDDQGAAAGIEHAAEDARALLYELLDKI